MSGDLRQNNTFSAFQEKFTREQNMREAILTVCYEIDTCVEQLKTHLRVLHHEKANYPRELIELKQLLENSKKAYAKLKQIVPATEYYKYHNCWERLTQNICAQIGLVIWLETNTLASPEEMADILGISLVPEEGFHLDINYYLLGIFGMCNELMCVAESARKYKRYTWPLQILEIVREVDVGLRMLELGSFKAQYNCFQYDIQKIEDIVYQISFSGELPNPESKEPKEVVPTEEKLPISDVNDEQAQ